ncbi:HPr family phosphocarrier protein [Halonotius roseus]|jgi:phosphocarrier protein|uniref:HPr family phosphocarrier protein n=1 Tax=Halonotius roseus TaxID=2511997 RepID=A0A544QME8_9EURY|nr:HPr family phosphocarrier protein [Halonotius roseus]TQQ80054.1 HPr family phosphocarrier protein [Halonotius roseus]
MERTVTVVPEDGLHARPATTFVEAAGNFDATITVEAVDGSRPPVAADSILAVTGLGVRRGDRVKLTAEGPDAEPALDALVNVISTPAGESDVADDTPA